MAWFNLLSRVVAVAGITSLALVLSCELRGKPSSDAPPPVEVAPPTSVEAVGSASGSVLYSSDGGLTWEESDLTDVWVTSIDRDTTVEGRAFASVGTEAGIEVYETVDGGATWSLAGRLPDAAGFEAYELLAVHLAGELKLLVGTSLGLWLSEDEGGTWERVAGLPEGYPRWLAAIEDGGDARVFVAVPGLSEQAPESGIYASSDLVIWTKVASEGSRLSESFDRTKVLAMDREDSGAGGVVFTATGASELLTPPRTHDAAGTFDEARPLVAVAGSNVHVFEEEGQGWRRAMDNDWIGLVVASPDFPASGVVMAGGYRYGSGIYRSTDHGARWEQVLGTAGSTNSRTLPVNDIAFLSPKLAVAAAGFVPEWVSRCGKEPHGSLCTQPSPQP